MLALRLQLQLKLKCEINVIAARCTFQTLWSISDSVAHFLNNLANALFSFDVHPPKSGIVIIICMHA